VSAILITDARVLTMGPAPGLRRGPAPMNDLGVIESADVHIDRGRIIEVFPASSRSLSRTLPPGVRLLHAGGRVLMPGFIDAHTHALWAGNRLDEWDAKRNGAAYLDILKAGGGIMSTVRAIRAATEDQLAANLASRLSIMLSEGTTTAEVKSGYGLSADAEIKMLRIITAAARDAGASMPTIIPTALIAHALDADIPAERFINHTIDATLPAITKTFPAITIDAFCEQSAWPLEACIRLFQAARAAGHPFRIHTDQFNSLGMTRWAVANGAVSVDHLEASTPQDIAAVAASHTPAVLLPCTGFHTDGRYAPARALIDAGAAVVIASNCNPGSSPCSSMPMTIALAVRMLNMTHAEALIACTANAAALLGLRDRGHIARGMRADLVLLRHTDERELAHEFGGNPVDEVFLAGHRLNASLNPTGD
jgi:imidazolonepropionase